MPHLTALTGAPSLVLADSGGGSSLGGLLLPILLAIAIVVMFVASRRNRKRQTETQQSVLQPGAEIITTAGMLGTVTEVAPEAITIEIAPGVRVRMLPAAIRSKDDPRFARARGRTPTSPPTPDGGSPNSGTD